MNSDGKLKIVFTQKVKKERKEEACILIINELIEKFLGY